jgi:hypothetical protein
MAATWKTTTAALVFCVLPAAAGATAANAAPSFEAVQTTSSVRPGETATFAFAVHGVSRCTLTAPGDQQTAITKNAASVTFSFKVGETVRPGRQWVIARCTGAPAQRFPLVVRAPSHASATLVMPSLPAAVTPVQRAARAWWAQQGPAILANFRNGQCTDWASQKRPDIVERVEEAAYIAQQTGKPFPHVDFLAKDWATFARLAGMIVSAVPVVGAIVVWQPGVEGAADVGHVGYVESVLNGSFTTSEENVGAPYQMGSRTLSTTPVPGRLFIYP